MVEVGEIENLKVDPVDSGVDPTAQRRRGLVDRAGGTITAKVVGIAPDRGGPPRRLRLRR